MKMEGKNGEVDRISYLPTELLHQILSSFTTEHVVRTCLISKHWRNIWRSMPFLHFDSDSFEELDRFVKFVDSVLLLRDGSNVHKLRLYLRYNDVPKINTWIIYAIRHNVQVLDMNINLDGDYGDIDTTTKFSPHIFNCASLREFKYFPTWCYFDFLNWSTSVCLPALRILDLGAVYVDGQILEGLISAAPSLETLSLVSCRFRNCNLITISSNLLKNLSIMDSFKTPIAIFTPSLKFFELEGFLKLRSTIKFNTELLSLVEANIGMESTCSKFLVELIGVVRNARSLKLSRYFIQSYASYLEKDISILNDIQIPFINLKWLMVETQFPDSELIFITNILKHCPEIEYISLTSNPWQNYIHIDNSEHYEADKMWPKFEFSRLKSVELQGFRGDNNELKMLKFLLKNAAVLEKLIVITDNSVKIEVSTRNDENGQRTFDISTSLSEC